MLKLTNITSGAVTQVAVAPDGSFDVQVSGSPDDAFAVQASDGARTSNSVYVARGGAVVTGGSANSCDQRQQFIISVLDQAASNAAHGCTKDSECLAVPKAARCYFACGYAAVANGGQQAFATAIETIDSAVCAPYTQDGCGSLLASCAAIPAVACSAGQCVIAPAALSCADREAQAGAQLSAMTAKFSDLSCNVDADCVLASEATVCRDSCGPVLTNLAGQAAIAAAVADIDNGLCSKFAADGCHFTALPCVAPMSGKPACHSGKCALDASVTPPDARAICSDAGAFEIRASDYDQKCAADSDCVAIAQGDACLPCVRACTNAAINKSASPQYQADIARVPAGDDGVVCNCPPESTMCCVAGQCHADSQCSTNP